MSSNKQNTMYKTNNKLISDHISILNNNKIRKIKIVNNSWIDSKQSIRVIEILINKRKTK